jgi:cation transport ATPase-like protein/haloacid dehalogenase-like hydrolase
VRIIAENETVLGEVTLDSFDRAAHPRIGWRQEAHQRKEQHARIEPRGPKGLRKSSDLGIESCVTDLLVDLSPQGAPAADWSSETELLRAFDGAIEGHPRHYLRVGEVLGAAAHFPNAFIRQVPYRLQVTDKCTLKRPARLAIGEAANACVIKRIHHLAEDIDQSGLKNLLDIAVLKHVELQEQLKVQAQFRKIDEMPFDFERRRMSVVLARGDGTHILICKGAVEEIFAVCTYYAINGDMGTLDESHFAAAKEITTKLNADGFRVVAVASKEMPPDQATYAVADEADLTLLGYIAFLDPPKETAAAAIATLRTRGVQVTILTGDNDIVTRKICHEVSLPVDRIVLGSEIAALLPDQLADLAETASVFAKVSPAQKAAIIDALHRLT